MGGHNHGYSDTMDTKRLLYPDIMYSLSIVIWILLDTWKMYKVHHKLWRLGRGEGSKIDNFT